MKWTVAEAKKLAKQLDLDIDISEDNLDVAAKKIRKKLRTSGTSIKNVEEKPKKTEGRGPVHYGEPYEEEEVSPKVSHKEYIEREIAKEIREEGKHSKDFEKVMLEFREGTSNKWYEFSRSGKEVYSQYGRIGSAGKQNPVETYASPEEAEKAMAKAIRKKLSKGYRQVS